MHQPTLSAQSVPTSSKDISAEKAVPLQPRTSAGLPRVEDQNSMMLCCYQNQSPKIQIIRSVESQPQPLLWHLERVIFPGQRLLFEAPRWSKIHVYSSDPAGMLVDDTVSCDRIQVKDQ
jgi:hypothetical protein